MPSLYTHQMIAKKVFDKLNKPNYIKNNFNEFLVGSLGLEPFNYHGLLKVMKKSRLEHLGTVLKYIKHRDFMLSLIEYAKGDAKHMVYTLGFITNYAADRIIRPYMHSQTERPEGGGDPIKQIEFEQALDTYLFRDKELQTDVVQARFLENVKYREIRHMSGLLSSVCRHVYPSIKIWKKDIAAAFIDTKQFTKKVREDKSDAMRKMRLYEVMVGKPGRLTTYVPPEIIRGNDIFNLAHRTWRAPFALQNARNESVTDLIEKSVVLAVDIINQVNAYYIGECEIEKATEKIGAVNFNGRGA